MYQKRGFTLIELLVVVLIIGILSAVALPQYQKAVMKSRMASFLPLMRAVKDAQERYYLANGEYVDSLLDLDVAVPPGNSKSGLSAGYVFYDNGTFMDALSGVTEDGRCILGGLGTWGNGCIITLWLDYSPHPGKTTCAAAGAYPNCTEVCKSMGY